MALLYESVPLSQCDSEPGLKGNYKYMEDVHFIIDTFNF